MGWYPVSYVGIWRLAVVFVGGKNIALEVTRLEILDRRGTGWGDAGMEEKRL